MNRVMLSQGEARYEYAPRPSGTGEKGGAADQPGAFRAPLIFLPGLLATSYCWRQNLPVLSALGDCYAPDFPGLGGSERLRRLGGISGLARWAQALAAKLQLSPAVVIGASWGGAVALRWALDATAAAGKGAQRRRTMRALILCGPANPFFRPVWRQRMLLRQARLAGTALSHMPARWHARGLAAMFGDPARLTPEAAAGYRAPLCRPGLGAVLAGYVAHWRREMAAMASRLGELQMPVLLLWGGRDRVVPPASARPLQAAIAGARLRMVPGAGHAVFEECPEAFDAAVAAFIGGLDSGTG